MSGMQQLYDRYRREGFTSERHLTTAQRNEYDAKPHKFQEAREDIEFKYVEFGDKRIYLFRSAEDAKGFDNYCGR